MTASTPPDLSNPDPVEFAWQEVERNWDVADAHQRFIALCAATSSLPSAGRHYREVRDRDPGRRAEAERRMGEILAKAMSQLDLAQREKPVRRNRVVWVGYGLSAFFLLYTLWSILRSNLR